MNRKSKLGKTRIGFFFGALDFGGIPRVYTELVPFLSDRYIIDFILLDGSAYDFTGFENAVDNVRVILPQGGFRWFHPAKIISAIKGFRKIIRETDYDIIVSSHYIQDALTATFSKFHGYKSVLTQHADLTDELGTHYAGPSFFVRRHIAAACFGMADAVVCVSDGVRNDLAANLGVPYRKCHVIHNPLNIGKIHRLAKALPSESEAEWLSGDFFHFISVGRLSAAKNFRLLFEAFYDLQKEVGNVRLTILGDGEERDALESFIKSRGLSGKIRLGGFRRNVFKYLARADCFVSSSDWEGFGNAIVEAMACGKPVIATESSGAIDILRDGRGNSFGVITPLRDRPALAEAMGNMVRNGKDREKYAKHASETCMRFHAETIGNRYAQLFEKMLSEK